MSFNLKNLFRPAPKPVPSISDLELYFDVHDSATWLRTPDGDGCYYPCGHGTAATYLYSILRGSPLMEGYGVSWTTNEE